MHLLWHAEYKHTDAFAFIAKNPAWLRDVVAYNSNSVVNKSSTSVFILCH